MVDEKRDSGKLAELAFGAAFKRRPAASAKSVETMADGAIERLVAQFEEAARTDQDGVEFWHARALSQLLDYSDYRNFINILERAKEACLKSGQPVEDHFVDVTEMVDIGSGATREIGDTKLTRYAAYLIAQNGDPRKPPVAFAQTYFAIQTRRQELRDAEEAQYLPLGEDKKRLLLRDEIKEHNKKLASAAKDAGVMEPFDFAIFQTFGYKGLYGGLDRSGIQRRKGLSSREQILDHMGSTELAANLFRATQTEEKLRRDRTKGKDSANATHYHVGRKVRETIREIGGTMPEDLPRAEDIVKVARKMMKALGRGSKRLK